MLNNLFGKKTKKIAQPNTVDWVYLNSIHQLDDIIETSKDRLVGVFKHSTRCIVSKTVLRNFEKNFAHQEKVTLYFLDLLLHRGISNAIADRFRVVHESPQLLLFREGRVVVADSHNNILHINVASFI